MVPFFGELQRFASCLNEDLFSFGFLSQSDDVAVHVAVHVSKPTIRLAGSLGSCKENCYENR